MYDHPTHVMALDLQFPRSLPEFQRLFPDEAACATYLERARGCNGFMCDHGGAPGEPYRIANRPGVLRCRHCNRDTSITAGTVMERTHTPISVWFWAVYWVTRQTPGISAVQFQRPLELSCYEQAFQILHKRRDIHHGVSPQPLQADLNEFTFRFNRRFYPFNASRALLGVADDVTAPTYAELDAKKSPHTASSGLGR